MAFLSLRAAQSQQQALSPRLQHAVRLLQLSSLDFAQAVQEAAGRNPFLESEDFAEPAAAPGGFDDAELPPGLAAAAAPPEPVVEETPALWQADAYTTRRTGEGEGNASAMDFVAAPTSLAQHLHGQLDVLPLHERDRVLAKAVVESLDDDGYLRTPLDELARMPGLEPHAAPDEMQVALRLVQSLDPAGAGARSLTECLLLQLPAQPGNAVRALARDIVLDHLESLVSRDCRMLAGALGVREEDAAAACREIRRLDPRPGLRFGSAPTQYVTPDVVVRKVRGLWTAQLNPGIVPKVRVNDLYADLFRQHRSADDGDLAAHLREARWTVRNVEQRFSTILSVAQCILRRQKHFLDFGELAIKPLALREIADEVGVHESTVSRVTNNKYMATPLGVFEFKYFFSRPLPTSSGGECSPTAVRGVVRDLIASEDPAAPLS
ncbi:MAG: RNA polymerase factor sigma-54, partial [Burkholderiaceae bacterium]